MRRKSEHSPKETSGSLALPMITGPRLPMLTAPGPHLTPPNPRPKVKRSHITRTCTPIPDGTRAPKQRSDGKEATRPSTQTNALRERNGQACNRAQYRLTSCQHHSEVKPPSTTQAAENRGGQHHPGQETGRQTRKGHRTRAYNPRNDTRIVPHGREIHRSAKDGQTGGVANLQSRRTGALGTNPHAPP